MTTVGLLLLAAIFAARAPLLASERPISGWQATAAAAFQVLAALILLQGARCYWILPVLLAAGNLGWHQAEKHLAPFLQPVRLAALVAFAALAAVMASSGCGLSFRDWHPMLAAVQPWFSPAGRLEHLPWRTILTLAIGLLLCANEANLLIREAFNRLNLKPEDPEGTEPGVIVINQEYRRGRIIGILERVIIFTLVFAGQYTAIGFVLAAKAMARFKTLDDRDFAEYFLIGTLLSVVLAGGLALAVRRALV